MPQLLDGLGCVVSEIRAGDTGESPLAAHRETKASYFIILGHNYDEVQ